MTKCIGCGIELQNTNINELGYVDDLSKEICTRCFKLANYGEYQKVSLNNTDYNKIIDTIKEESLIVYTSDILSLNLTNINKFKRVLLVITKRDILPKSVKEYKLINYIKTRYTNILDVIIISSIKNYNIDLLYNILEKLSNNKPIYLVGNTNTGKSTLLNKLIKNYSDGKLKDNITVSMYPSTTLDKVSIKLNNLTIIDTPGLIDDSNIMNYLSSKDLKKITPKKEIKPKSCQINGKGSIIIDNYARIDYETKDSNSMVIYASNSLNIRFNSLSNDKLKSLSSINYKLEENKDIVIPGLGFIKFVKPISVTIYTLDKVVSFERDNLI